jgi:hypothetical protein
MYMKTIMSKYMAVTTAPPVLPPLIANANMMAERAILKKIDQRIIFSG